MKTTWVKGFNAQAKEEMEREFDASARLRNRLSEILSEKIKSSLESSRAEQNYELTNWAFKQADSRGYERALSEVISLLSNK